MSSGGSATAAATPCEVDPEETKAGMELFSAVEAGDEDRVEVLLKGGAPAFFQRESDGRSVLMQAAGDGQGSIASLLLQNGAPWNAFDKNGRCAGDYAILGGHQRIVDALVSHGCAAEMLLTAARASERKKAGPSNIDYLSGSVRYEKDDLIDADDRGVMMAWEKPLMQTHAQVIVGDGGTDVLNVGFGLGLVDTAIQELRPASHTIIEAHPDVYAKMERDGWTKRATVLRGRWQDRVKDLVAAGKKFHGIFFDTFGEYYEDQAQFQAFLPQLLHPGGVYSFFNGLCPTSLFLHAVACEVVRLDLLRLGITAEFHECAIDCDDAEWEKVKVRYWHWKSYYLPVCRLTEKQEKEQQ